MFKRVLISVAVSMMSISMMSYHSHAQGLGYGDVNTYGPTWAGFYAGVLVGGARTSEEFNGTLNASGNADGYSIGLFGGGNAQMGNLVMGVEAELGTTFGDVTLGGLNTDQESNMAGRVRAGVAVNDRVLLFFTTGLANTSVELTAPNEVSSDVDLVGWQAGIGAEALISSNIFVRGDYIYTNYFDELIPSNFGSNTEYDLEAHQFRVGLGYKFQSEARETGVHLSAPRYMMLNRLLIK